MTETETEISSADKELARRAEKFSAQEQRFEALENNIATLRTFFAVHHDAFAPFAWSCYGWNLEIEFCSGAMSYGEKENDAKAIARAFGGGGWKRDADISRCGQINWVREFESGIKITIRGAEFLKPNLIPEVKL